MIHLWWTWVDWLLSHRHVLWHIFQTWNYIQRNPKHPPSQDASLLLCFSFLLFWNQRRKLSSLFSSLLSPVFLQFLVSLCVSFSMACPKGWRSPYKLRKHSTQKQPYLIPLPILLLLIPEDEEEEGADGGEEIRQNEEFSSAETLHLKVGMKKMNIGCRYFTVMLQICYFSSYSCTLPTENIVRFLKWFYVVNQVLYLFKKEKKGAFVPEKKGH